MAVLLAGLPMEVSGSAVNRLCGSELDAVGQAASGIRSGDARLMIAGNVVLPEVERLIEWLPKGVLEQARTSFAHGDYRIDHVIYAPTNAKVIAVIDWELAMIGDPLADLAYLMMNWVMPVDDRSGLLRTDFARSGIPSMDEAIAIYCRAADRDNVPDLHWYFAFSLSRLTGIVQGIKQRMLNGSASSADAKKTGAQLFPLARAAWKHAQLTSTV